MFQPKSTEEIINIVLGDDADGDLKGLAKAIDEACEKYAKEHNLNAKANINKNDSKKEEDKTLNDLRQKLINYLYELKSYDDRDIELLKILFSDFK